MRGGAPRRALAIALETAEAAGRILRARFPRDREIRHKEGLEVVTDADYASQEAIVARLGRAFPGEAVLSEEGLGERAALTRGGRVWVVDPLDGTNNYARRLGTFAVAIARVEDGEPMVGVVHDPMRRETFYAASGIGAFVKRPGERARRLRVSSCAAWPQAVVATDWPREPPVRARALEALGRVAPGCTAVRMLGSVALSVAYIGSAVFDAYYHFGLQPWDVAASAVVAREAGATITALDGSPWRVADPALAVSNGALHGDLLASFASRAT